MANEAGASDGGVQFEIKGLTQFLRLLSKLPKDLQADVRDASGSIASDLITGAKQAAHAPQQSLAASGLKVKRDRIPAIRTGGAIRAGVSAKDIFYGAEFGGQRRSSTMQFPVHRGQRGYWLYPTLRSRKRKYVGLWADAVDKAFSDWNHRER